MYVPKHFAAPGDEAVLSVLRATDFATLVTARGGVPAATHLPVVHSPADRSFGAFRAHFARANPHWRELEAGAGVLVICRGPHGYVSPTWYREREVPTWDYVAVHAWCRPRILERREEMEGLLRELMRANEERTGTGGRYEDYPADFLERMLRAIVGVELTIERAEAAFKLSQNRGPADRESVCAHLRDLGDPSRSALADAIERFAPNG